MKKGFTLLELLSVIIILAVITLIAVPIVSGVVTKVKLGALKSSAYGLLEASDLYYARYNNTSSLRFDIDENVVSSSDTNNLLSYKGKIKEGTVIINKKGETTLCITDGTNSVYKNYRDQKVIEAANKRCNIPSSTYVVYLDNTATINELSNQELTEVINKLQAKVTSLETELSKTNSNLETVATVAGSATLDKIFPVGSIYMTTVDDTPAKVAARFGGTWVVYGDGRFIKSSASESEKIGGSNSVTLTASEIPSLTISGSTVSTTTSTMNLTANTAGSHSHYMFEDPTTTNEYSNSDYVTAYNWYRAHAPRYYELKWSTSGNTASISPTDTSGAHAHSVTGSVTIPSLTVNASYTNSSVAKVNVQNKYITVYMYKRTA